MRIPLYHRTIIGALCALLVVSGCATGGGGSSDSESSGGRFLLTEADLAEVEGLDAHDAIRRLRPNWLRYRGQAVLVGTDRESLRVYVNRNFFGDADSLKQLFVRDIQEIRYLDARQATLRFGTDHTVGAILVTTRR